MLFRQGNKVPSVPMRRLLPHFPSASLLLVVMLFTALPRTLFHHCEEGLWSMAPHEAAAVVHTDTHCPICEAPAPVLDGLASSPFSVAMVLLGAHVDPAVPGVAVVPSVAPRLRGPPGRG